MKQTPFKSPAIIGALIGSAIVGSIGTYLVMDRSLSCPQAEDMAAQLEALSAAKDAEEETLKRLHAPPPPTDYEQLRKNHLPF